MGFCPNRFFSYMGFCPHGILSGYRRKDRVATALVALDLAVRVVAIVV